MSVTDTSFGATASNFVIKTPECLADLTAKIKKDRSKPKISRTLWMAFRLLSRIQIGEITLVTPTGHSVTFTGDKPGPKGTVIIHNDRAVRRFLLKGHLGFCESYLDKEWESPDIAGFFEVILANGHQMRKTLTGKPLSRFISRLVHLTNMNSLRGSRKNIYAHYDIGNEFYSQWLDPSMTYSSALFLNEDDTLEIAQENKYRAMAEAMQLEDGMSVLEIGCGWGGFAEFLASHYNINMTCVTISKAQYDYAVERIKNTGLDDRVTIKLQDYRLIEGQFDRIGSIEMFEAVGEKYWPVYFGAIDKLLKKGGRAIIQTITIGNNHFERYRRSADFIQRYIFPGGMLPSPFALNNEIRKAGLRAEQPLRFGQDYARTLQIWNQSFQKVWPKLEKQGFDGRFKRLWELYLHYCDAGFRDGTTDVIQIPIVKN